MLCISSTTISWTDRICRQSSSLLHHVVPQGTIAAALVLFIANLDRLECADCCLTILIPCPCRFSWESKNSNATSRYRMRRQAPSRKQGERGEVPVPHYAISLGKAITVGSHAIIIVVLIMRRGRFWLIWKPAALYPRLKIGQVGMLPPEEE